MDDHDLHLVDQRALDLRHGYMIYRPILTDILPSDLDGDACASGALHCMPFLSSPPKYSERNDSDSNEYPEMGPIYTEWKATCNITLPLLCGLLQQANTSLELVQFISNHDVHPTVQKAFSADRIWGINILAYLSRASVCSNWRIISAIQRSLITTHQQPSNYAKSDEDEESRVPWYSMRYRWDPCCSGAH